MNLVKNLSDVLSFLMSKNRINSAELARKTGVAQPVVSRLMTGVTTNPQILTIKPIADFFGVNLEQLLGIKPIEIQNCFDDNFLSEIRDKINSITTVIIALSGILPVLIESYNKAILSNLIKEEVPAEILPLFILNIKILLKTTEQIQKLLQNTNNKSLD